MFRQSPATTRSRHPASFFRQVREWSTICFLLAAAPVALACNTPAECNVKGQFHRAQALELSRSMTSVRESSRSYDASGGVSGALAQSFKQWEDSKKAEQNAADAREREADRKAVNVRFSADDIKNDQRRVLIIGAEDGRATRQNQLGVALLNGELGFSTDKQRGMYWLRKAAAQGNPDALVNLADILINGDYGVTPDPLTGLQLYTLLIGQGGSTRADQAAFTMNKAYDIYDKYPEFYPHALDAALNAQATGAPGAGPIIFHYVVDFSVTPHDARLRSLLESPDAGVDIRAARAVATRLGVFGIRRDVDQGQAMLQTSAAEGHEGARRFLALLTCLHSAKSPDEQKKCSM
jgi:TPR repeat protein